VSAIVTIPKKRGHKVAAPTVEIATDTAERPAEKSAIVTVRRRGRRFADVPDMTPRSIAEWAISLTPCGAIWCAGSRVSREVPARHWRSYGDDKLPTGTEALGEPFAAFPSWFRFLGSG
jgi:hypothetical protein